ncbi:MAG: cytochrome c family protein [Desulfamplus sp.]|nr:cytochrome c family protein [Desulfamplus sp.]
MGKKVFSSKVWVSFVVMVVLASFTAITFAGEPTGDKRKGKYSYRKVYKACMERGEVASERPFINPSDKTMAQWQRVFETKDFAEFKCSAEWGKLSAEEIEDIYSYLYGGAADSPSPAKCK